MSGTGALVSGVPCLLELYSGIGGMRTAMHEIGLTPSVCFPYEIHPTALTAYHHNFSSGAPKPKAHNLNGLTKAKWDSMKPSLVTLSPPCQPYTRQGRQLGEMDARNNSLELIISLLAEVEHLPSHLLLENVRGFEGGASRHRLGEVLRGRGFAVEEFLLSPRQLGIPNSRMRYYLLAWKRGQIGGEAGDNEMRDVQLKFPMCVCLPNGTGKSSETSSGFSDQSSVEIRSKVSLCKNCRQVVNVGATKALFDHFSKVDFTERVSNEREVLDGSNNDSIKCGSEMDVQNNLHLENRLGLNCTVDLGSYLSRVDRAFSTADYALKTKDLLRYVYLLDIVDDSSERSCCFTKNYSRLLEGAGSVYNPSGRLEMQEVFRKVDILQSRKSALLKSSKEYSSRSSSKDLQKCEISDIPNAHLEKVREGNVRCQHEKFNEDNIKDASYLEERNDDGVRCPDLEANEEIIRASDLKRINEEIIQHVAPLGLRFFSPAEVLALMGFPDWFRFPPQVSDKSAYKLAGNSVNVVVVSLLLRHLLAL